MAPFDLEVIGRVPNGVTVRSLLVRHDGSILIAGTKTISKVDGSGKTSLYLFPAGHRKQSVGPITLKIIDYNIASLVELGPGSDVFAVIAEGNIATNRPAAVQLLNIKDLHHTTPAFAIKHFPLVEFPPEAQGVSGCCLLTPNTMLVADGTTACIWRVNSNCEGSDPKVQKWLSHESLRLSRATEGELAVADIGLHFNECDGYVYFTSSQSKLLARVKVEGCTLEPAADIEIVATGLRGASRLLIDDKGARAYVANMYDKVLERIRIPEVEDVEFGTVEHCLSLAGTVFPGLLAAAWCSQEDVGRYAYIITKAEYLSMNLDQSHRAESPSSIYSSDEDVKEDNLVTRVIKVRL